MALEKILKIPTFTKRKDYARYREACRMVQPVDKKRIRAVFNHILSLNQLEARYRVVIAQRTTRMKEAARYHCSFKWPNSFSEHFDYRAHDIYSTNGMTAAHFDVHNHSSWLHEVSWLCLSREFVFISPDKKTSFNFKSDDLLNAFEAGAWFFIITGHEIVVFTIPTVMKINSNLRLHCETGPAISYLGYDGYYINGIQVTQQIVMAPETLETSQIVQEPNVEIRRIMLERYGFERFINNHPYTRIDTDVVKEQIYGLYQFIWPNEDDEIVKILRVTNSTPEPDGSFKNYYLRVPPGIERADDALAWTFNMNTDEYRRLAFES